MLLCIDFRRFTFLLFVALLVLNSGCLSRPMSSNDNVELPQSLLYVVAMDVETRGKKKNDLVVLNADTFEEVNRTRLMDNTLFFKFSQDPLGRIWIGYGGTLENKTKRVDLFEADGTFIKSFELCTWPNVRISFAAGRAFIPCYMNGYSAKVAVIDLDSLETVKIIDINVEPRFSLRGSTAVQDSVVVVGGNQTHTTLLFIDPYTLEIQSEIPIYGGGNMKTIVDYEEQLYMLNKSSAFFSENPIDMRIVQFGEPPTVEDYKLAERSPSLGFIANEILWTYHHRDPTSPNSKKRAIARYNLATQESDKWSLPDSWWAGDMIMLGDKIVVTRRHSLDPNETDGLYQFSPDTNELTQILELSGAHLLLTSKIEDFQQ